MSMVRQKINFTKLKKAFNAICTLVALISVAYVFHATLSQIHVMPTFVDSILAKKSWLIIMVLSYACLMLLPAYVWSSFLLNIEQKKFKNEVLAPLCIYGVTSIGKYIPGNVFHYVGRQALGVRAGYESSSLIQASLAEALSMISAVGILVLLFFSRTTYLDAYGLSRFDFDAVFFFVLLSSIILLYIVNIRTGWIKLEKVRDYFVRLRILRLQTIILSVLAFIFFISCSAFFLYLLLKVMGANILFTDVLGLYALSYVISYISPGLPGGVGIREGMIVLTIGNIVGPPAVVAALSLRLIFLLGELFFWAFMTHFWRRR